MNNILESVKKILGLTNDYDHFDPEIIMHINSVFAILTQLGIGPDTGYSISTGDETWEDYITDAFKWDLSDQKEGLISGTQPFEMLKTYMGMRVKYMFDPPSNGAAKEALKSTIDELEWRINIMSKEWKTKNNSTEE